MSTKTSDAFDVVHSPIRPGKTLIEASAGTGKTYTLAGIFLRLLLEQELEVDQILVTTYTELATAELRDRIRRLLRDALDTLDGRPVTNDLLTPLLARYSARTDLKLRLQRALQCFDEAPIYTIHGFCRRMLKDRAFESRELFDAELVTDQSHILGEVADDFWRAQFYTGNPFVVSAALSHGITSESLLKDLDELIKQPTLQVIPSTESDLRHLQEELVTTLADARRRWEASRDEFENLFRNSFWANRPYNRRDLVIPQLEELAAVFAADASNWSESLSFFSTSAIARSVRARHTAPRHELFDSCQRLVTAKERLAVSLRATFLAWAPKELHRRKARSHVLSFDDLLLRLHHSLGEKDNQQLASSIRERFRAALIDEFQDTDPIQYAIFDQIYSDHNTSVFFIGDPKQSIYGFRGADVYTYLQARTAAKQSYTLTKNWRTETGLIEAINTLFTTRQNPFLLHDIPFRPAEAAGRIDNTPLTLAKGKTLPLILWLVKSDSPMAKGEAAKILPNVVADEIARLLNSDATIGTRRVMPHDIAVLVATNGEARAMQLACADRRIPSVIYSAANVFESSEARELLFILSAVVEPAHERKLRAALATETLGLTSEGLENLNDDESTWEERALQFQRYQQIWREEGFVQMLRTLILEQGVRRRLLRYPGGERRLTNLLHLMELLHKMCAESRLGMTGLLKRLQEAIETDTFQNVEYEMRLERDADSVRIATVHKSKGLEYGIVFCPFAWEDPWVKRDARVVFHAEGQLFFDLENGEANQALQLTEKRADKLRLLYVAVTRAKHRCYLVWGNLKTGQDSALSYLLGKWSDSGVSALKDPAQISLTDLPEVTHESFRPEKHRAVTLQPRIFKRPLDQSYGIASFTRLISAHAAEPIVPEYDSIEATATDEVEDQSAVTPTGIFAFPRGTRAGTCLHKIFEELDFSDPAELRSLVRKKLRSFDIKEQDETVVEMVQRTLSVPLGDSGLTLSRIKPKARLSELEFYFPVGQVTENKVRTVFRDTRLRFAPMRGFMKGFIDLVFEHEGRFFILDWKSNWLGPDKESYNSQKIESEMEARFYKLQLAIYAIALHRFLRARLKNYSYGNHFGGAYYLFLRGLDPDRPELGVYSERPPAEFIESLDSALGYAN